jgi:hypothetical protein
MDAIGKTIRIGAGPPGPRRRWWHHPLDAVTQAALVTLVLLLLLGLSGVL